jgi:hypothetical protein
MNVATALSELLRLKGINGRQLKDLVVWNRV